MANIRLIKRRIRVTRNISQITKAMEMVAASKMRKAQEIALAGKPYAKKIYEATSELAGKIKVDTDVLPLLKQNLASKILVILISTNKGLCGGLNSSLFRALNLWFPSERSAEFISVGKKGEAFVLRTGRTLVADFSSGPFLVNVGSLTNLAVSEYIKGSYKEVWLVYNNFVSILNHTPIREKILPIEAIETVAENKVSDFVIEPDAISLLQALLPHYLEVEIRKAILESEASEHSARMMAMKAATDNAEQLKGDLTLEYNKIRQQLITYEIADIVTAREAIQG